MINGTGLPLQVQCLRDDCSHVEHEYMINHSWGSQECLGSVHIIPREPRHRAAAVSTVKAQVDLSSCPTARAVALEPLHLRNTNSLICICVQWNYRALCIQCEIRDACDELWNWKLVWLTLTCGRLCVVVDAKKKKVALCLSCCPADPTEMTS